MLRYATIQMETELTQEEFETWLLVLIKAIATDPEKSAIIPKNTLHNGILAQ